MIDDFDSKVQENIKEFALNLGVDLVGFSCINKSPIPKQEELTYAITIAVKLPDAVLKTIEDRPTISYFHEYRSANTFLDNSTFRLSRFIENLGYLAFPIPASQSLPNSEYLSTFSHKIGARLSGLGFIGKSGLFVSTKYGSKVRLATVLTNLPLRSETPIIESACKNCNICVNACPAGAISGKEYVEGVSREELFSSEKCSHTMKRYKDVGRGAVCGICIKVCPYNNINKG